MLHPIMAGEDFAFMLNAKRGSYILLGSGRGQTDLTPHQPDYDFNDEILPIGASYWARLSERLLLQRG
jgi:metal-dependent amidase/aminoacylase/carboxypeptidase family protein